jgi:hypothetical protein
MVSGAEVKNSFSQMATVRKNGPQKRDKACGEGSDRSPELLHSGARGPEKRIAILRRSSCSTADQARQAASAWARPSGSDTDNIEEMNGEGEALLPLSRFCLIQPASKWLFPAWQ